MNISDLKEKKITVMGLGLHGGGIGTVRFLSEAGARVTVTDIKSEKELKPSLEKLKDLKNISYVFQQHRPENFTSADIVIKTPPVPWNNKYIKMALDAKVSVEIDSSLFFKLCKNTIIGVTGTKGKTTTASLIYEILKIDDKDVLKVGVGQISVLDKLKNLKKDTIVVFELSSWRLSALGRAKLSPQIAVITNIYPDHLNYYKSMEEYVQDKKHIYLHQNVKDSCVISADNEIVRGFEEGIKSRLIKFSKNKINNGRSVYLHQGTLYINDGIDEKEVLKADEIKIRGEHNLENILAAVAAAWAVGAKRESIKKAVIEFEGIEHRFETVRILNGVRYIHDTSATTPESAIRALESTTGPVILICGGSDKNLNMDEFGKAIYEKAKGVIFLKGKATEKIIAAVKKASAASIEKNFEITDSMEKAVELANIEAKDGDEVLLAPGAASFGLFANEFDRGNQFKEAVKKLK
jgi:UDP-N-acetylmuramoylalanine--D-glutamate ligase